MENSTNKIGLRGLVFALIGSTVGSGWLFAGLYAAQIAGPAAMIAWVLGGGAVFLFSLVYMELGIAFPISGGMVKYSQLSHGPLVGFVAGVTGWFCYVMVAPLEVLAILQYALDYLPILGHAEGSRAVLSPLGYAVAVLLLLAVTVLNLAALRWVIRVHDRIVLWKLLIPTFTVVLLLTLDFHPENFSAYGGFFPHGFDSTLTAIMAGGILFSTYGFRVVVDLAGEAENPRRNIPRAIALGLTGVVLFYILLQFAFLGALAPADLAEGWGKLDFPGITGPYAALLAAAGLGWMAVVLYVDAILSPLGTGIIFSTSTSRVALAMAEARFFPGFLATVNRRGVPARAVWLNFAFGLVLLAPLPDWQAIVSFGAAATMLSFAFAQVTLAAMRWRGLRLDPSFRLPCVHWLGGLNFVVINCLLFSVGWHSMQVLAWAVALALVAYSLQRWRRGERLRRDERHSLLWLGCYLVWIFVSSWMGIAGGGRGWLTPALGYPLQVAVSAGLFLWAVRVSLNRAGMTAAIEAAGLARERC